MIDQHEGFTHSFQYRFHTVERTAYPRYAWSEDPQPQKPLAYDVEWIIDGWERITFADVAPDQIGHVGGLIQSYLDATHAGVAGCTPKYC
jgi:hypothetical protein